MKIKVIGSGSIGNHMAHASISLGHSVIMCDIDEKALLRTSNQIYPERYGKWDKNIQLYTLDKAPQGNFDLIIIGTPPNTHIHLALEASKEKPKAILIEKPLCEPFNKNINKLKNTLRKNNIQCFIGYNHCLSDSINYLLKIIKSEELGKPLTLDVEFREHWKGIFKAHPWLKGPQDTYLGFSKYGGGATGEHSHALNLWIYISSQIGFGNIINCKSLIKNKIFKNRYNYDELSIVNLETHKKYIGRVVQDVITYPSRKCVILICTNGILELFFSQKKNSDLIRIKKNNREKCIYFKKTRPDDFIIELKHIEKVIRKKSKNNIISLDNGIKTMKIIEKIYKDNK